MLLLTGIRISTVEQIENYPVNIPVLYGLHETVKLIYT